MRSTDTVTHDSTSDMTQALKASLTPTERAGLVHALRGALETLQPASGPLDQALRGRYALLADVLDQGDADHAHALT